MFINSLRPPNDGSLFSLSGFFGGLFHGVFKIPLGPLNDQWTMGNFPHFAGNDHLLLSVVFPPRWSSHVKDFLINPHVSACIGSYLKEDTVNVETSLLEIDVP